MDAQEGLVQLRMGPGPSPPQSLWIKRIAETRKAARTSKINRSPLPLDPLLLLFLYINVAQQMKMKTKRPKTSNILTSA